MIRTGHYWLSILPDDIREKFLKNYWLWAKRLSPLGISIEVYLNFDFKFPNFIGRFDANKPSINTPFAWDSSSEGYDYWSKIAYTDPNYYIKLKRNEKINDILEKN